MAERPHRRGRIGLSTVGYVAELESFTVTFQGDPEDLEAIEGTVGQLEAKGKRVEISGTLFIPAERHVYNSVIESWDGFTRVEMIAEFGNKFVSAKGRFNAPEIADDGTRCNFTFRGSSPIIREL